jgi:uncharacterized protein YbbC (DUF1343 family)
VHFVPADFRPQESRYKNVTCHGVQIILLDRQALDAPVLGIEIISALYRLYQEHFLLEKTKGLIASRRIFEAIREKEDPASIAYQWQERLRDFLEVRERYLLYQ